MSTLADEVFASSVAFTEDSICVHLVDGRTVIVPLEWYPTLSDATHEQRQNFEFIGKGLGIHWPDLDEDLSVKGFLAPSNLGSKKRFA